MEKLYKYWLYYLDNELYAYTDNNKYAKMFESIRDMNKFVKIKKEFSKEGVNNLAEDFQSLYLSSINLSTYDEKKEKWIEYEICVNGRERLTMNAISAYESFEGLQLLCWVSPKIFNKKIQKALEYLNYTLIHNSISDGYDSFNKVTKTVKIDQLKAFINEYGFTLGGKI